MKKNSIVAILVLFLLFGCSKPDANSSTIMSSSDSVADSTAQIANPWREISLDDIAAATGTVIALPDDAQNVYCQVMDEDNLYEVSFLNQNREVTYRIKKTAQEEDISGLYYDWNHIETVLFHDNEEKKKKCTSEEDVIELASWYDTDTGLMHSLGVIGDKSEFDVWNLADQLCAGSSDTSSSGMTYDDIVEMYEFLRSTPDLKADDVPEDMDLSLTTSEAVYCEKLAHTLIDLDGDGEDELLIMNMTEDAESPYYTSIYGLYTIKQGKMVPIFVNYIGTSNLSLRENNVLCFHVSGTGYYQDNYATYTGDPENPYDVIESVTMDGSRPIVVDGENGFSYDFGMGLFYCDKDPKIGLGPFDLLPEDMTSGTKEEWIQALNEIDGFTLIDENEASRIDAKYPHALPETYTMFSDSKR